MSYGEITRKESEQKELLEQVYIYIIYYIISTIILYY